MTLLEKKYAVDSFDPILNILKAKNLSKTKEVSSTHYYGQHPGKDVEKFVEYADRFEVHAFKESNGKFIPTEDFIIKDKNEGIEWLKKKGYKRMNLVKMDYSEYSYKNGSVGLYIIDDSLHSVILNYPEGEHEKIEKEFGLEKAVRITIPYNKQLEKLGLLRSELLE